MQTLANRYFTVPAVGGADWKHTVPVPVSIPADLFGENRRWIQAEITSWPGLAEYELKSLRPGSYLQAITKDLVRKYITSQQSQFALE